MKDVLVPVSVPLAPRAMHDRLYAGEVLHFADLPQMAEIVAFTRGFVEDSFGLDDPTEMHRHLTDAEFAEVARSRSREYGRLGEVERLWRALFEAVGLDPGRLARDRLYLRFQPPEDAGQRLRGVSTAGFHRDTWGTNLYAQVNWWAPVYPITAGRTVALYPTLWSRPIANTSAEFDITAAIAGDRQTGRSAPAEMVPRPTEDLSGEPAVPVVIAPGTVITFSSAQAHAGVPNHTGVTRISLETRTLWIPDVLSGAGAPNVDGHAPLMSPGLFRRVGDGARLDEVLGMRKVEAYRHRG